MLLRMVLWVLLLPMGIVSIFVPIALFDRDLWSGPNRFARFLAGIALVLPGVSIAYALLVDWSAVAWVGISFLMLLVAAVSLIPIFLREQGISFEEVKAQIRSAWQQGSKAETLDRVGEVTHAGPADAHPQVVSQLQVGTLNSGERGGWQGCVRVLRTTLAAELALWLAGMLFVSWIQLPGYGSLLIFLSAVAAAAYYIERLFAARLELAAGWVPQQLAHRAGCTLFTLGNFLVVLLLLVVLAELGEQISATSPAPPPSGIITFLTGLGLLLATCGWSLMRLHPQQAAQVVLETDCRPPVLYLRSFARESRFEAMRRKSSHDLRDFLVTPLRILGLVMAAAYAEKRGRDTEEIEARMDDLYTSYLGRKLHGNLTAANVAHSMTSGRSVMFDEQLFLANLFNQIGPYVAIERPNRARLWRTWSDVGSAKLRVPDSQWQEKVLGLIEASSMVVVEAGSSMGLLWELDQIVSLVPPRKVLLILPERERKYRRFRLNSLSIFPVALPRYATDLRFVMFDENWKPVALRGEAALEEGPSLGVRYAAVLQPFFERNGFTNRIPQPP